MRIQEATAPQNFEVTFKSAGSGLYKVAIDGKFAGNFDEDDLQKFVAIKLTFIEKLKKMLD